MYDKYCEIVYIVLFGVTGESKIFCSFVKAQFYELLFPWILWLCVIIINS